MSNLKSSTLLQWDRSDHFWSCRQVGVSNGVPRVTLDDKSAIPTVGPLGPFVYGKVNQRSSLPLGPCDCVCVCTVQQVTSTFTLSTSIELDFVQGTTSFVGFTTTINLLPGPGLTYSSDDNREPTVPQSTVLIRLVLIVIVRAYRASQNNRKVTFVFV